LAKLILSGSTSGSISLESPAVSGTTTLTLPTTTDTLVGKTTTDTLTNKTLTSPVIAGTPTGVGVLTSGTVVASTSGTSIDFTSIPSWVKRITVMLVGVSTSGTSNPLIQIGAGSVTTSGYLGAGGGYLHTNAPGAVQNSSGFQIVFDNAAAAILHGHVVLTLATGNTWVLSSTTARSDALRVQFAAGSIALGGTLDRIRLTTVNGTDTFDAGSVNILYE
jgi:hypothetical protein